MLAVRRLLVGVGRSSLRRTARAANCVARAGPTACIKSFVPGSTITASGHSLAAVADGTGRHSAGSTRSTVGPGLSAAKPARPSPSQEQSPFWGNTVAACAALSGRVATGTAFAYVQAPSDVQGGEADPPDVAALGSRADVN